MIPRYTPEDIRKIWSDENKYELWLEVELAAGEAMEMLDGTVPQGTLKSIRAMSPKVSASHIQQLEQTTKHDVIAFLTHLEEVIGPNAKWLHRGMTSSDIVDTSFAMQLRQAMLAIIARCDALRTSLACQARKYALIPMIGRSHGMAAEPITFGLALAGHFAETTRNQTRLRRALDEISYGKLSGAVGTYAHLNPSTEAVALDKLGLSPEWVSTQVIPRDRHAEFFYSLAATASGIERLATNIRHWQRSEVNEVSEPFRDGQKGSSAMPHKRNPIASENMCGLARVVRSYCTPAMENVTLWHERDISHSSAERIMAPDATALVAYMLDRMKLVIDGFNVNSRQMQHNIDQTGEIYGSEAVLLELVEQGMMRQAAYVIVQRNALSTMNGDGTFRGNLKKDPDVTMSDEKIDELLSMEKALRWVPSIIDRVLARNP